MTNASLLLSPMGAPLLNAFQADPTAGSVHVPILTSDGSSFRTELLTEQNAQAFRETATKLLSGAKDLCQSWGSRGSLGKTWNVERFLGEDLRDSLEFYDSASRSFLLIECGPPNVPIDGLWVGWHRNDSLVSHKLKFDHESTPHTDSYAMLFNGNKAILGLRDFLGVQTPAPAFLALEIGRLLYASGQYDFSRDFSELELSLESPKKMKKGAKAQLFIESMKAQLLIRTPADLEELTRIEELSLFREACLKVSEGFVELRVEALQHDEVHIHLGTHKKKGLTPLVPQVYELWKKAKKFAGGMYLLGI